jgi:hypothetical protein
MRTTRIALFALCLAGAFAGARTASAAVAADIHIGPSGRATVDLGFFYDDLSPYGHWVDRPQYGWVWTPRAVASTWRPYQNGHWAWTDEGWIWITDEPYGWATYHYGRWYDDPDYGWSWVPGNDYAPAWVSWQEGGDYIGWAPLPPSVQFSAGPLTVSLAPDAYLFVPTRHFLDSRPFQYAVPRQDCERVYRQTHSFTEYQVVNQRIVNRGVPVDQIQRVVGRPVPRYQVAEMSAAQRHQGARISGNRLTVFRPEVQKAQVAPPPQRPVAKRAVLTAPGKGNNRAGRAVVAGPVAPPPAKGGPQPRGPKPQQQPAQVPTVAHQPHPQTHEKAAPQSQPAVETHARPPAHQRPAHNPHQEQTPPAADNKAAQEHHNPRPPQEHAAPQSDRPARQAAHDQPPPPHGQPKQDQPPGQPHGQQGHPNQGNQGGGGGGRGHDKKPPENDKKPPV